MPMQLNLKSIMIPRDTPTQTIFKNRYFTLQPFFEDIKIFIISRLHFYSMQIHQNFNHKFKYTCVLSSHLDQKILLEQKLNKKFIFQYLNYINKIIKVYKTS